MENLKTRSEECLICLIRPRYICIECGWRNCGRCLHNGRSYSYINESYVDVYFNVKSGDVIKVRCQKCSKGMF